MRPIVRTLDQQIWLWIRNALTCYGLKIGDVPYRLRKKLFCGGKYLLRTGTPTQARDHVYDIIERVARLRNWDMLVKAP